MTREQLENDLAYVAGTLRNDRLRNGAPAIYLFWALAIACGFALPDFQPKATGLYWLIVAPLGGLLSAWLGMRHSRALGLRNREEGRRWGWHFLIGAVGWIGTGLPMMTGKVATAQGSPLFLLVTGLVYAYAGLHIDRGLRVSGWIALAGFVVMQLVDVPYAWTTTGVLMAVALLAAAWSSSRGQTAA